MSPTKSLALDFKTSEEYTEKHLSAHGNTISAYGNTKRLAELNPLDSKELINYLMS
jgi:hypothetical protein